MAMGLGGKPTEESIDLIWGTGTGGVSGMDQYVPLWQVDPTVGHVRIGNAN
jgi:hypothetical protein